MRYSSRIVATMALISIFNQHRLSATGPRSRPATKTDKEGNVGAETAIVTTSTRAYGISATANDYCHIRSSAPPSCRNWTLNVTPVTDRKNSKVQEEASDRAASWGRQKAIVGSVKCVIW